jgi:glycosyltransferase involved in cell wall biosynthesis
VNGTAHGRSPYRLPWVKIVSVMTTGSQGGAEFAAVEMLDALVGRGHEAVLVTDQPTMSRDKRIEVALVDIGPKLSVDSYRSLALHSWRHLRRLRTALEAQAPYDVLLVHYKKEQLLARWLPLELRRTLVWAEWGPVPFPMRRGLARRMYLGAAERAVAVLAISEATRRNVSEVGVPESKVHYVPNVMAADDVAFTAAGRARVRGELEIPPDAFVVGCISRFHPKKRNDVVVDAVARLGDAAHLIMAGDGETEADLRARAAPLGERAHFVRTPGGDVADYLSAFDVSVFCPSPTEGAPRAVLLGMLASRPCLSTGPEGVADIIVPGVGAIAEPENDPASLVALLREYADDPERIAREGAEARRRVESTYAAPVVAEQIEQLLHRVGAGSS